TSTPPTTPAASVSSTIVASDSIDSSIEEFTPHCAIDSVAAPKNWSTSQPAAGPNVDIPKNRPARVVSTSSTSSLVYTPRADCMIVQSRFTTQRNTAAA